MIDLVLGFFKTVIGRDQITRKEIDSYFLIGTGFEHKNPNQLYWFIKNLTPFLKKVPPRKDVFQIDWNAVFKSFPEIKPKGK